MCLSREIYYGIRLAREISHKSGVAYVTLDKSISPVTGHVGEVLEIPAVGQFVEINYPYIFVFFQHQMYKIGSYEPASTGYK